MSDSSDGRGDDRSKSRRGFFRLLFEPLGAAVQGARPPVGPAPTLPPRPGPTPPRPSTLPAPAPGGPAARQVLRHSADNRMARALIGPLGEGHPVAGGFVFTDVEVEPQALRFRFEREAVAVTVVLAAPGLLEGPPSFVTRTFAGFVEGTAAPGELQEVARQVALQAAGRDQGQLWRTLSPGEALPTG